MRHFRLIGAKTGFRSNEMFARMGLHRKKGESSENCRPPMVRGRKMWVYQGHVQIHRHERLIQQEAQRQNQH